MKPNWPVPFAQGSDTSEAAAKSMEPSAGSYEAMVRDFVFQRKRYGATADEVLAALSLTHQNGSARVSTLKKKGILVPTERRRKTRSGRHAVVLIHKEFANKREKQWTLKKS